MKKILVKISFVGFAALAIALIPGNAKLVFGYGSSSSSSSSSSSTGSSTNSSVCGREKPAQVVLYQPNHPLLPKATGPNQVRLNWLKVSNANKYTVAFGLSSGNYIYGVPDVGNTDHFTVGSLASGQKYYFVVRAVNDCMPGPWSMEWAVRGGGGSNVALLTNANTNSPSVVTPPNVPSNGGVVNPGGNTNVQQPAAPHYVPPQPNPTPQPGFFQKIWHGILGVFGIK